MTAVKEVGDLPQVPELLTIAEAADIFRCSKSSIYEWMRRGELRALRIGGRTLIPRSEIDRRIAEALA